MQFHLVFVGKTSFPEASTGIRRYLDRLRHYGRFETHTVKAEKIDRKSNEQLIRNRECDRILKLVGDARPLVVWDERGRQLNSPGLARFIAKLETAGTAKLWMVVGGPLGLTSQLRQRADHALSLSLMTFPHDLARLLVVEQIYRAFTILRGEPYHK